MDWLAFNREGIEVCRGLRIENYSRLRDVVAMLGWSVLVFVCAVVSMFLALTVLCLVGIA